MTTTGKNRIMIFGPKTTARYSHVSRTRYAAGGGGGGFGGLGGSMATRKVK